MGREVQTEVAGGRPLLLPGGDMERTEHMTKAKAKNRVMLGDLDTVAACNKPFEVEIRHPVTGEGTGVFFSVLGSHSDTWRNRVRAIADQALRNQAMGKAKVETLDAIEKKNIDALVAATVGWRHGDEQGRVELHPNEWLDFTPENVCRAYTELLPVREQVAEALNNLGNFMPA